LRLKKQQQGREMGLRFENLDAETRRHMVAEIDRDAGSSDFYFSNYLTADGQNRWPGLLRQAAVDGTDDSLAASLRGLFKGQVERKKPSGGFTMVAVPVTAAETLSQSQFNMYYMRALAIRAQAEGRTLTVYRARASANPRPESERMIGSQLDPDVVLQVLRRTKGVEPDIQIPMPNSGITVRLS
jgi:hypothetical protein